MCLTVEKTFKTRQEARDFKPLIAKKDIKVYKYLYVNLKGKYVSPYLNFEYEKGYHYTAKISKRVFKYYSHLNWSLKFYRGLHAFLNPVAYMRRGYIEIVMYVPKGSQYYIGTDSDIVSDNLIWY